MTTFIACLLALINIGSFTAFNDVLSLGLTGFYSTYLAASGLLLWRRCTGGVESPNPNNINAPLTGKDRLVWGPWRLPGVLGIVNNAFACGYMLVILVFSLFPATTPTTLATMNYAVLVTAVVVLFSVFYYFVWGRKWYKGPVIEIEAEK
jgi:choline transport protein